MLKFIAIVCWFLFFWKEKKLKLDLGQVMPLDIIACYLIFYTELTQP